MTDLNSISQGMDKSGKAIAGELETSPPTSYKYIFPATLNKPDYVRERDVYGVEGEQFLEYVYDLQGYVEGFCNLENFSPDRGDGSGRMSVQGLAATTILDAIRSRQYWGGDTVPVRLSKVKKYLEGKKITAIRKSEQFFCVSDDDITTGEDTRMLDRLADDLRFFRAGLRSSGIPLFPIPPLVLYIGDPDQLQETFRIKGYADKRLMTTFESVSCVYFNQEKALWRDSPLRGTDHYHPIFLQLSAALTFTMWRQILNSYTAEERPYTEPGTILLSPIEFDYLTNWLCNNPERVDVSEYVALLQTLGMSSLMPTDQLPDPGEFHNGITTFAGYGKHCTHEHARLLIYFHRVMRYLYTGQVGEAILHRILKKEDGQWGFDYFCPESLGLAFPQARLYYELMLHRKSIGIEISPEQEEFMLSYEKGELPFFSS